MRSRCFSRPSGFFYGPGLLLLSLALVCSGQTPAPKPASPPAAKPATPSASKPASPPAQVREGPPNPQRVTLENNAALFSLLTALDSCSPANEAASADPIRGRIRADLERNLQQPAARAAQGQLCRFYKEKQLPDPSQDLAQYISLALNLGDPPGFALAVKEADLAPDAAQVLGLLPLLVNFNQAAGLEAVWKKYQPEYHRMIERYHGDVAQLLFNTDIYLKIPLSTYVGRRFVVYLEPMSTPGQVNSRNYGEDYFLVASPSGGRLKLDPVRHVYLHYVLDPMALKRPSVLKRLEPLLESVRTAPLDASYKNDVALLITESLIRAVEVRMAAPGTAGEQLRQARVQQSMEEGFVLTRYFYDRLASFEKDPAGMKDSYGELLYGIDLAQEKKRAAAVNFATQAAPDVVRASKPKSPELLDVAEQRLRAGDPDAAQKLAQQALEQKNGDPAQALFILARAATLNRDINGAKNYFERTLAVAREPRQIAWSHIYLGRLFDLMSRGDEESAGGENRKSALLHYQAALSAGDNAPETKAAAERGLKAPYTPPAKQSN